MASARQPTAGLPGFGAHAAFDSIGPLDFDLLNLLLKEERTLMRINNSVGNRSPNNHADVMVVQRLLNKHIESLRPLLRLVEDGNCGPATTGMIIEFQKRVVGMKKPDGRVDPAGKTFEKLLNLNPTKDKGSERGTGAPYDPLLLPVQVHLMNFRVWAEKALNAGVAYGLVETDFVNAAIRLGVEVATIKAVAHVESAGSGFLANGLPKILFEGHWFSKLTSGQFDAKHPTISYKNGRRNIIKAA